MKGLRSHHDVHRWRRRAGLVALALTILALFVLSSRLRPTEAAAAIERAIDHWVHPDDERP